MPARFDKLGISFQYPDNWTLDDSDALLGRKSVTVYSPGGGFWTVAIHSGAADPSKLAAAVLDAMKKEYPGLEIDEAFERLAGHDMIGYDLAFYYLDLINTALIRSLRVGQTSLHDLLPGRRSRVRPLAHGVSGNDDESGKRPEGLGV